MSVLSIPVTDQLLAHIPFPMSEAGYKLLLDTLALWKPRLVPPLYRIEDGKAVQSSTGFGLSEVEMRLWERAGSPVMIAPEKP